MLREISEFLVMLLEQTGLIGVFVATVIESFFAPIPSEIVLFTAGYYANGNGGIPMLLILCFVASLGNFVGTLPFYLIAKYSSEKYLPRFIKKWGPYLLISQEDLKKSEDFFSKRGSITVFLARLIPGARSLIAFPAGLAKMNMVKYTLFTLAGSFIWNLILGAIGFWAFDRKEEFFEVLDPISNIIIVVLGIAVLIYATKIVLNIRRLRREATSSK
jgi:membrane protein DedA with SNARE-associated domain